jgi:hypothetical protein
MMLKFVIFSLRMTLSLLILTVVTILFGRGPTAKRVLRSAGVLRRIGRL